MMKRRCIKTVLLRIAFCLAALLVAGLALYPNLQLPEPAPTRGFTDKIYHVVGCLTLVLLAANGWHVRTWVLYLALPLSASLEVIQGIVPGRGVHIADMVANVGGVALALLLLSFAAAGRKTLKDRARLVRRPMSSIDLPNQS